MEDRQSLDQQVEVAYQRLRELMERSGASPEAQEEFAACCAVLEEARSLARFPAENPNPVLRLDPAGALLYANEASAALLREWGCRVGDPLPPAYCKLVAEAYAGGTSRKVSVPSGERVYSFDIVPIVEAGYVNLYGRDVTARVRAETEREAALEALRESEERFRTVADFTYDWEYWAGVDGRYLYVSPSCERITGYRADEFMQNPGLFETIVHPDDRAAFVQHQREKFGNNEAMTLNFRILTRAGEERWISHVCMPVYGADGRPLGRRASNRDVTERMRAESQREAALEALRRRERDFSTLVENAADMIVRFDANLRHVYCNPAVERQLGIPVQTFLGKTALEVGGQREQAEFIDRSLRKVLETGQELQVEQSYPTPSGVKHFQTRIVPEFDPDGHIESLLAITRDITGRVQAESQREAALSQREAALEALRRSMEQLTATQAQLIQAAKLAAVGELAAGVAHELNNPLTSILGFAELLLNTVPPDIPFRHDLEIIARQARRARDIVRNLLDFARQNKPQQLPADVNQIVRQTLDLIRQHIEKSGITIAEDYASDLGLLTLDIGQMKQVFLNLITNATHAMPKGGSLSLRTARIGDEVAVAISDTGVGIPPDMLDHIFEPFFTTKEVGQGTGLGLSISLGIVQEHGGRITVASRVAEPAPGGKPGGSTFTVWLPAEK